jgi:formyltetrahydrofolate deformylase
MSAAPEHPSYLNRRSGLVLSLTCPDRPGLVRDISSLIAELGGTILDSEQFSDLERETFYIRIHFQAGVAPINVNDFRAAFTPLAEQSNMHWSIADAARRPRVLILASRQGHCLNDLLFRASTGFLHIEIAAVVSNHPDLGPTADRFNTPFHYVPVTPETKAGAEATLLELVDSLDIELVVLARYMQILSESTAATLQGRVINIHHSMLPSFKGARPYEQAYRRGVKLIGATAHYVTADLDEGPIIEQEVARISHKMTPADVTMIGRDTEALALARAVRWHTEGRVLLDGSKTIVLR